MQMISRSVGDALRQAIEVARIMAERGQTHDRRAAPDTMHGKRDAVGDNMRDVASDHESDLLSSGVAIF